VIPGFRRVAISIVIALAMLTGPSVVAANASTSGYVGTALTPGGDGHWMVDSAGRVATSGAATFMGDMSGVRLNKPVVGMSATASGRGYWLVASDGGIFSFGDARFHGSTGSIALNKPVVGLAGTPTGKGYWLVASDGGIFSFGDARFHGSTGSIDLNQPVVGMTATDEGKGYWLVGRDGGIFAFGDARFLGSGITGGTERAIAILRNDAGGYSLVRSNGSVMRTEPAGNGPRPPVPPIPPVPTVPPTTAPETPTTTAPLPTTTSTTLAPPTTSAPTTTTTQAPTTTTTAAPTTTTTTAAPVLQPQGPSGKWRMTFSDEFSSSSLNESKWTDCYWWATNGCTNEGNNELEWYMPDNVSQSDGKLHMTAKRQVILGTTGKTYQYTSGMVTNGRDMSTYGGPSRHEFTYGYVEARVKVPKGKGLWPAVWLLPVDNGWPPEIDVMEYLGHEPNKVHMTHHWSENGQHKQSGSSYSGPDFSQGYHTFGVNWQPDSITWYIDGVERKRFTNASAIPNEPMYVLLNLAVGGNWPGSPDANTPFPSTYSADWVRIWKNA
jgi:beta-glucanase (GH16 family)